MIVNGDDVILENEKKLFSIIIYLYKLFPKINWELRMHLIED